MVNAWIGYANHYDDATILVATNEVATLPIANVRNSHIVRVFRTSASSTEIDLTMPQRADKRHMSFSIAMRGDN